MLSKMTIAVVVGVGLGVAAAPLCASAASGVKWVKYDSPEYGFSMLVPAGAKVQEQRLAPKRGMLIWEHGPVSVMAMPRLNYKATPEELEKHAVSVTGMAEKDWKAIGKGRHERGWVWWKAAMASPGGIRQIIEYGVGAKGTYLMVLTINDKYFHRHRAAYRRWYRSIRLH